VDKKLANFTAAMDPFMSILAKPPNFDTQLQTLISGYDQYSTRSYLMMGTDPNQTPMRFVLGSIAPDYMKILNGI
jgi:hypothetical protein